MSDIVEWLEEHAFGRRIGGEADKLREAVAEIRRLRQEVAELTIEYGQPMTPEERVALRDSVSGVTSYLLGKEPQAAPVVIGDGCLPRPGVTYGGEGFVRINADIISLFGHQPENWVPEMHENDLGLPALKEPT